MDTNKPIFDKCVERNFPLAWKQAIENKSLFRTDYGYSIDCLVSIFGYEYVQERLEQAINEKEKED